MRRKYETMRCEIFVTKTTETSEILDFSTEYVNVIFLFTEIVENTSLTLYCETRALLIAVTFLLKLSTITIWLLFSPTALKHLYPQLKMATRSSPQVRFLDTDPTQVKISPEIRINSPLVTPPNPMKAAIPPVISTAPRRGNSLATLSVISQSNTRRRRRLSSYPDMLDGSGFINSSRNYFDKVWVLIIDIPLRLFIDWINESLQELQ